MSAERQLTSGQTFFRELMEAIEQPTTNVQQLFPYLRIVIFPNEQTPSPKDRTEVLPVCQFSADSCSMSVSTCNISSISPDPYSEFIPVSV